MKNAWVLALALLAVPVEAQDRLQPDFTFRRVRPPAADHAGPRITVQITGDESASETSAASPGVSAAPGGGGSTWFWSVVPAGRSTSGAVRMQAAMDLMRSPQAPTVPAPRLAQLQGVAQDYGRDMLGASVGTRVSPALALAVVSVESAGRADAQSHAGAQGLMQLIPATAERFGVEDPMDPAQNIRGGIAYLDWLIDHFDGDMILAIAAYNAGEGAVRDHDGVPPYPETRAYVPKVLAAWQVARGLCQTPPQLLSDGCVFVAR